MKIYWQILAFNFQRYLTYPLELTSAVLVKVITVIFLIFFWSIIAREEGVESDVSFFLSYFLLAHGVSLVVMSRDAIFGRYIRKLVQYGIISSYMLRPLPLSPYLLASAVGKHGALWFLGIGMIILGIIINPPTSFLGIMFFSLFMINAIAIGYAFNLFEGCLSFIFTEVTGIKNALLHLSRVFSGYMVPLTLFPENIRLFAELTFFPSMVFYPVNALSTTTVDETLITRLLISTAWAVIGNILIFYFWRYVQRKYEAVGI